MLKGKTVCIIPIFAVIVLAVSAQSVEDFALHIKPSVEIPVGERSSLFVDDAAWLIGGSLGLTGQYIFPNVSFMYLEGNSSIALEPSQAQILTLGSVGTGIGMDLRIADVISLQAGPDIGGTYAYYQDGNSAFNPYFGGKASIIWDVSPTFAATLGGVYRYHLGWDSAANEFTDLYQGVSAWLGGVIRFNPESGRQKLGVSELRTDPVFPVFYSYYENNSLGTMVLQNNETSSITNVDVYLDVGEYMEQPMLCRSIDSLARNEAVEVDLHALFTNRILNLTESSKVSAEIRVEYTYLGERFTYVKPHTIRILDRNSMTWDDDRKAASFVTPRDPTVLIFSKNTAGLIRDLGENPLNLNFRIAIGVFEALRIYGMNYVIDPQSSYIEASQDSLFLDYLQFPSQSLTYRAGDCDDLSILMAALLESVGIETAFITIPGHIFMAFSLDLTEEDAQKEFVNTDNFIYMDGKAWVPLEITLIQQGFLKAYDTAAKQWRDSVKKNSAGFFPIHSAWQEFEPVGFTGSSIGLIYPSAENIIENYNQSLDAFVSQEIRSKVEYYKDRISRRDSAAVRNSLGVLYGKYGLFDKAEEQLQTAIRLDRNAYNPPFNLGNIYFLKGDYDKALSMYEQAKNLKPESSLVLAGLARTKFELEQFDEAQADFAELTSVNAALAENYTYIGNTNSSIVRASAALDKGRTFWDEEEE